LSFGQLVDAIQRVAASLTRRGLGKGEVFAIHTPNLPEYAVAFHAVSAAGGVSTTANPLSTMRELYAQLWDSRACYLLTVPSLLPTALEAARRSRIREVFVFGGGDGATPFAKLLQGTGDGPAVEIDPDQDLVALPYLGHTLRHTFARGVMLSHRNMVANILQTAAVSEMDHEVVMAMLPFFRSAGLTVLNVSLYLGATTVTMPRFDLEPFLDSLQQYGVTHAYLGSRIAAALATQTAVNHYDLPRLRHLVSVGDRLDASVEQALADRFGCRVHQWYGLTESSVVAVTSDDPAIGRPGSWGVCIPNTEISVVDVASGAELGPTKHGQILVRGPQLMKGYLDRSESTAHAIDKEGWLHTGDTGYVDRDGYIYIVERPKNTYWGDPGALEEILVTHPGIADAAVIKSSEGDGEEMKAFVVLKYPIPVEEIMSFVAERVRWYNRVHLINVVDQIPRTPAGMIRHRALH
jgi:acyl-CoA synthetase (AMP-forming)/AMP-acid ligase II